MSPDGGTQRKRHSSKLNRQKSMMRRLTVIVQESIGATDGHVFIFFFCHQKSDLQI